MIVWPLKGLYRLKCVSTASSRCSARAKRLQHVEISGCGASSRSKWDVTVITALIVVHQPGLELTSETERVVLSSFTHVMLSMSMRSLLLKTKTMRYIFVT